jgi:hypothetical protein
VRSLLTYDEVPLGGGVGASVERAGALGAAVDPDVRGRGPLRAGLEGRRLAGRGHQEGREDEAFNEKHRP